MLSNLKKRKHKHKLNSFTLKIKLIYKKELVENFEIGQK